MSTPKTGIRSITREGMIAHQRQSLRELLGYLWRRSPFYRDFYESYGIREPHLTEIGVGDLPFLTKQILMDNFDQAVTDPRLNKADLEQWLQHDRGRSRSYQKDFIPAGR